MGNKETTLREIFEDIDISEDKRVTVEELKYYLNDRDPKVEQVLLDFLTEEGEYFKFIKAIEFMEKGDNDLNKDEKYSFDEFKTAIESNQDMKEILLKIADAKEDSKSQQTLNETKK